MISFILIFLSGILNAIMDVLDFKFNSSIFATCKNQQWINPNISWKNKWKYIDEIWIGEKFFGSSTFLVFLTDLWHLCKFLMLLFIMSAIVFYNPLLNWWVDFLLLYCIFTITFEIFFSKVFIKKK
jgi:hypothetical protein